MTFIIIMLLAAVNAEELKIPNSRITSPHFCTVFDSNFKEFRYKQQIPICKRKVSYKDRTVIYSKYKILGSNRKHYTIDHLIPLSLGGSNDARNLWPQPKSQSTAPLETRVYYLVKKNEMTIQEAWNLILREKYPSE